MKRIVALAMVSVALASTGFRDSGVWVIDADSRLTIAGSTNVNRFICELEYCTGTDTLQYVENSSTKELRFTRGRMTVPIRNFDCGARPISKDFWQTLRAETHPNLQINFISLQNVTFEDESNTKGVVEITLAGSSCRYIICYAVSIERNGDVHLDGVHAVKFSDFGLEAPEKLKGLIKVNEGLTVNFNLVLKEI